MTPLFLFGTLQHRPLMEAVLGASGAFDIIPATMPGYRVEAVAEGPFPMISHDAEAVAEGLVVTGLSAGDITRLDYYETAFGYQRQAVTLSDGREAECYFPPDGTWTADGAWSLDAWAREWGAISVISACEVMTYLGQKTPQEIAAMFPMIRARAWSQLNAARSKHGARTMTGQVEVITAQRPYASYFAIDEIRLRHERFDAQMSPEILRAVFRTPDAALVLPYDPVRDRVLLVEQMRIGPQARGDRCVWQLEPVAGRLDPGETPQTAARREAQEEAGLTLGAMECAGEVYPSPGVSSEFLYFFVGQADLGDEGGYIGGLDAEGEDIRSHVITFDSLIEMCDRHQVANAPLVAIAYWLARHRPRLRAEWAEQGTQTPA